MIYIDLKTDSGVSSLSTAQLAKLAGLGPLESGMEMAPEGNRAFVRLSERFQRIFGFPYMVPVAQGRAAERIWGKLHVKESAVVAGNMLFPSTRFHIESNGGKVVDVISESAHDLYSAQLFKGDVDLDKLEAVFQEHGGKVCCVYVELCVNSCGGHPVSLGNLKAVKAIAAAHKVPLFLDACRILENSYLVKQREPGYQNRSMQEIVNETCLLADGCTMSALKDFLVPVRRHHRHARRSELSEGFGAEFPQWQPTCQRGYGCDGSGLAGNLCQRFLCNQPRGTGELSVAQAQRRHSDPHASRRPRSFHRCQKLFAAGAGGKSSGGSAGGFHLSYVREYGVIRGRRWRRVKRLGGLSSCAWPCPARRYLQGHIDDVAEAVQYAYSRRNEIKGLKKIEKPGRSRFEPALFAQL